MTIYSNVTELIGRTPLLSLDRLGQKLGLEAQIVAKLEYFNPAGSVKDRAALSMINSAEKAGLLGPNATIIEPTSGNTGIGLACIAAARGYKTIFTMPESMSIERRKLLAAYGARIELTPASLGMKGAIDKANELAAEIPNSIVTGQFVNPANPAAHYSSTGPEIWQDTQGQLDFFVAGIGTGGTITGVGSFLKEQSAAIRVVAVEPADAPFLSQGQAGPHKLQGIGAGFAPDILDTAVFDEVMTTTTDQAFEMARLLAQTEGVLVGISSGAALSAAARLAADPSNKGKRIVVLLPDTGERYLSSGLFD
ncbi:MAG: cysteine synthase A [Duodenibacillus sp.]|nr:cysteine synthase A [Duodenibacillus sp.]